MTRAISIAAAAAMLAGCSVATTVRQNTMAINGSSDTIRSNTAPMSQLAALGTIFNRPLLLAGIGALALAAWGLVTFVAVRFAILSASRAYPKAERPLTV